MTPAELLRLNRNELARVTRVLGHAVNQRLKRIQEANLEDWSPAYQYIMQHGGRIRTAKLNLNQLRREFTRASQFLRTRTGTVRGVRQNREKLQQQFKGANMSNVWAAFNYIKDNHAALFSFIPSDQLLEYIIEREPNTNSLEQLIDETLSYAERRYEEENRQFNEMFNQFWQ